MSTSSVKPMKFDHQFQKSVLKLMIMDHNFCFRACTQLQPAHFTERLSWFFDKIKEYFDITGELSTKEGLAGDISAHALDKQADFYQDLDDIFAITPAAEKIKHNMEKFTKLQILTAGTMNIAKVYNKGTYDDAFELVGKLQSDLEAVSFDHDPFVAFGDGEEVLRLALEEKVNAIPTGIRDIDESMGGGMLPGTWTTFLGASNVGKSMLMPSLAKAAALSGKRVFVTIHEDEENPTKLRYLSCFSGIPVQKLMYGLMNLTEEEKIRFVKADDLLKEKVKLRFMYTTESAVEHVISVSKTLMKEWPYDLFLCDYGQCLTSNKYRSMSEIRHLHEYVYHSLKQMCLELKIPGAGPAQVNRAGMSLNRTGGDLLRCTDVSEAFGIIKKSNNVITMNRSEQQKADHKITFLLDKTRNGKCPTAVLCNSDYASCTVYKTGPADQTEFYMDMKAEPSKEAKQELEITTKQSYQRN